MIWVYDISLPILWQDISGNDVSLEKYKGKVLLIVNVASQWYLLFSLISLVALKCVYTSLFHDKHLIFYKLQDFQVQHALAFSWRYSIFLRENYIASPWTTVIGGKKFQWAIIPPLTLHFVASSFLMSFACSIGGCLVGSITVGLHKPTTQNSRSCTTSTKGKVILNSSLGIFDCSYGIVTICAKGATLVESFKSWSYQFIVFDLVLELLWVSSV